MVLNLLSLFRFILPFKFSENESLKDTNDKLVNSLQEHQHKLFNLENLKRDESINKKHVAIFEKKVFHL